MALQRRKLLAQALNLGYGTDTVPADSGGLLTGDKVGIHTLLPKHFYSVLDFGAVGDGVTDDRVAIQTALTLVTSLGAVLLFPAGAYKITSALTANFTKGGGIIMASPANGAANCGILVSGTGYTALTVTGNFTHMWATVYGTGNAADGVLFDYACGSCVVQYLGVYSLNGYGVKMKAPFNSNFGTFEVSSCGSATEYAFSIIDSGANVTSSTRIANLQVELATTQAIYISAGVLNLKIGLIHSERLQSPDSAKVAWYFGGGDSVFGGPIRLQSNGTSANAKCKLEAGNCTFIDLRTEGNIPVFNSGLASQGSILVGPQIASYEDYPASVGGQTVTGGIITAVVSEAVTSFFGTTVAGIVRNRAIEGTFVPALKFGGAAAGMTYTYQNGNYSKLGTWVQFIITLQLSAKGASVGAATITGLPFTSKNSAGQYSGVHVNYAVLLNLSAASNVAALYVTPNTSTISISEIALDNGNEAALTDTAFSNTTFLMLSGQYQSA